MGGLSVWHLLIVLLVLAILFGTGRLKSAGKELGSAVKELKSAFKDDTQKNKDNEAGSAS